MSVERSAQPAALRGDTLLLFITRFTRLFAYGSLSVVLVLYLTGLGLRESQVGLLLTLTLLGDTAVSLALTTQADKIGRRRMLLIGAVLMVAAGIAFACTRDFLFMVIAGTVGVISPSGNEVGPFLPIEQAALAHVVAPLQRTSFFAWYSLVGSLATAVGSLAAGFLTQALEHAAWQPIAGERAVVFVYAGLGGVLGLLFLALVQTAQ
jgi:MFS family permease